MNDGKVICALTNTGTCSCTICGATLTDMQNLNHNFEPKQGLEYGITSLHLWINSLNNILKLAYRLDLYEDISDYKNMKVSPEKVKANKLILEKIKGNKKRITDEIYKILSLRCDKIVLGKGTSNTGNVARIFFKNYKVISEITGIQAEMLKNIYICMICITSTRFKINVFNFKIFARKVYEDYVRLYSPIQTMSPSLHKLLQHTADIALHFDMPLGRLSEENIEKSHQFVKKTNEYFCRQISQISRIEDLMNRFLCETDPTIGEFRVPRSDDIHLPLIPECRDLLEGKLFFFEIWIIT